MSTLRPDSIFAEYEFTPDEKQVADTLSILQIQKLQTLFAQKFKHKAATIIPRKLDMDDREFLCQMAELEGELSMIQQLLADHQHAITVPVVGAEPVSETQTTNALLHSRASNQVHNQ